MGLEITGRVVELLPEQSGTGRSGDWRKQEFILEIPGKFPKQVCVAQWGDNIEKFAVTEGETLTAHIDLQSREHNGRWYTDVKAWRVDRPTEAEDHGPTAGGDEPRPDSATGGDDSDDGLPF